MWRRREWKHKNQAIDTCEFDSGNTGGQLHNYITSNQSWQVAMTKMKKVHKAKMLMFLR
jgi:hypothetical protein